MKYLKNFNTFLLESLNYSGAKLTTLVDKNIPEIIKGEFDCSENELTSLKGAPKKISEDFWCIINKLKNLDHLPEISGRLFCYENDWEKPIPYKIMIKYNLHSTKEYNVDFNWVYTNEQFEKFSSFDFQKDFLENEPENFMDLKPIGYAKGLEDLFPHLFDMDDLGLLD